jgi:hypothetical protein
MSIWTNFATVRDYPKGLMNLCPCGQVVLAPALYHEGQAHWDNPDRCKELWALSQKEISNTPPK